MALDGRTYTISFQGVSVSAQMDLVSVMPAANKPVRLDGVYVANVGKQEESGDAKEDFWQIDIVRLYPTAGLGSGGSTGSPYPLTSFDQQASFVSHYLDTTKSTGSPPAVIHGDGMNNRVPYIWMPPPEQRITCSPSEAIAVRLDTTPTNAGQLSGTFYVTELG